MIGRKIKTAALATITATLISGCASQGGFQETANSVGSGVSSAASAAGEALSFLNPVKPFIVGIEVTEEQMAQLEPGMSTSEVESILGYPPEIQEIGGKEVWNYPYTATYHFRENINETTVVRFDANGEFERIYKANGRTTPTGHPVFDAAAGLK